MSERTSVGLDVHARSGVACAIDGEAGERRGPRCARISARSIVGCSVWKARCGWCTGQVRPGSGCPDS